MAGRYEVKSWHVDTFLDLHSAETGELPPVAIEIAALDQGTDIRDLISATPRSTASSGSDHFIEQLQSRSGFEAELIFSFPDAQTAVASLFRAVMTDAFFDQLVAVFWDEARVPVFGSAPQEWVKLTELLGKYSPEAAIVVVGVGVLHVPALTLVLAVAGMTIAVRVLPKAMTEVGEGLASVAQRLFRRSR
jgi:hypothetical protein